MAYSRMDELKRVKEHYSNDPLQKRFSAIISGETNGGKTFLLSTCRFPVHIDSFDPGGTKCLRPWIERGDIVVDTTWENEDPYDPKVFADWKRKTDVRLMTKYFEMFGTYALDSLTTFGDAAMGYIMKGNGRAGEVPKRNKDYNPQKIEIINRIKKLMTLPCDFILTAHLKAIEEVVGETKYGEPIKNATYRILITGQAVVTIPLLFDEIYVITGRNSSRGVTRELLIDSQGKYLARSRLKSNGKLSATEPPNIKKILKKAGFDSDDKPKLSEIDG